MSHGYESWTNLGSSIFQYLHVLFKILHFKLVENWKTEMVFLEGSDLDFEMTQV